MESVTLETRRQVSDISLDDTFTREGRLHTITSIQNDTAVCRIHGNPTPANINLDGTLLSLIKQQIIGDAAKRGENAMGEKLPVYNLDTKRGRASGEAPDTAFFAPKSDITTFELAKIVQLHAPIAINLNSTEPMDESIRRHFK